MNIDWSEAPEYSTHYGPAYKFLVEKWFMLDGESWRIWDGKYWSVVSGGLQQIRLETLIPRPSEWTGEGLPPVGLECEVMGGGLPSTAFDWERCKILLINEGADGKRQVCTRDFRGDLAIYYPEIDAVYFRPIRTPAQAAAEARAEAILVIAETMAGYKNVEDPNEKMLSLSTYLYDHGIRMQVKP